MRTLIDDLDMALCRSALYEALVLGFRAPNAEMVSRLLADDQNQALAEIAAMIDETSIGDENLSELVRNLIKSSDIRNMESLRHSHRANFGHVAHSAVPPYETEYGEETLFQQPQQLADIAGFYEAFGLQFNIDEHERVDHICGECEFLAFLTRKEAYAIEQSDMNMLQETRKAQKLFLKEHLARFLPSFANLLIRENQDGFYASLARLARAFILRECARYNISAGPERLRLRPKVRVDECFTCGAGEEVIRDMCRST